LPTIGVKETLVMRKTSWVAWGLVVVLGDAAVSAPPAKSPRTVVDYYMLLPDHSFDIDRRSLLNPKYGAVVDVGNGYIRTWHDGAQQGLEVALFRRPNGSYLVAVNHIGDEGPDDVWSPWLDFLTYRNGRWVDVTKATLPRRFSDKLGYEPPRYGRTIRVVTESEKHVYDLVWTRGRLQVKRRSR
jgi:hypothetical protein